MKNALKSAMALAATIVLMLAFRALAFTVYTVRGTALEPCFIDGDRVLVNRWSYGLRTGGGTFFRYARWAPSQVERGDLVIFNNPADTLHEIADRDVLAYYCTGVPGDTVTAAGARITVPGRRHIIEVTADNAALISFIYNRYEGRSARTSGGRLYVDGEETRCAAFSNDYYWFSSGRRADTSDSRYFGLVPETFIIGKAQMLLYSVDPDRPAVNCLRPGRRLQPIITAASGQQTHNSKND